MGRACRLHPSQTSSVRFVQSKRTPGPPQGCLNPKPSRLPHCGLCPSCLAVPGLQWRSPADCGGSHPDQALDFSSGSEVERNCS